MKKLVKVAAMAKYTIGDTAYKGVPYEMDRKEPKGWRYRVKIGGQLIQSDYFESLSDCLVDMKKQVNSGENLLSEVVLPTAEPAKKSRKKKTAETVGL